MASLRSRLSSLREYLTPINHNSNFATTGQISPEEFVSAGDYLVYKFPTWQWSSAPKNLQKSFLPEDKQFLITRHVPSYQRALKYIGADLDDQEEQEEEVDGWVKSHKLESKTEDIQDIDEIIVEEPEASDDDVEFILNSNNQLRKYDLYVTYSTSYRVPKMYLVGFSVDGIPLLPEQMFEDIQSDYKDKTATIESLPVSYNTMSVSIHPCNHSTVMKVMMKYSEKKEESIRVDQYLIVFLKFIASVTPGIEYDYTADAL